MKKTYKIAIYSGGIPSTTFVERLIIGLSKSGCEIYLFGSLNKQIGYKGSISSFAYKNTKFSKAWFLLRYSMLLGLFRSKEKQKLDAILKSRNTNSLLDKIKCYPVLWHQPDVFHVQWAKGTEYWSWVQEFGIKLVLSLRGAHINYSPIADQKLAESYRRSFPMVDQFHAVSDAISKEAQKYGAASEKINVVYSGLDLKEFKGHSNSKNGSLKIISVGRSHWKKGYHYALDACHILKSLNISFSYTIIGAKGYLELMYQIKDLGLENHVKLLNSMPIEAVKKEIQESNLLLLPSVEEGIANVVLEAMALRTLVLTSNCGGMEEVIKNDVNGFVFPVRNANALAEQIMKIDRMPDSNIETMLDRARKTIELQHTEGRMVDDMVEVYKKVLNADIT